MSKYAFFVSCNNSFQEDLCALLNSLDFVGNEQDVHLYEYHLDKSFLDQLSKLNYKVIVHTITEDEIAQPHGLGTVLLRKRYLYMSEIGIQYDAVCMLDADMVFVANPIQFFQIVANTDLVLGVHKEQNKVYCDLDCTINGGEYVIPKDFYNDKDLCAAPIFLNVKIWGKAMSDSWNYYLKGFTANDMDAMNVALIANGAYEKIIKMSNHSWLGTNESLLKPYCRAVIMSVDRQIIPKIKTENGQDIFSFHGKYKDKKWRDQQLLNRHQCAEGYLKATECSDDIAQGSMDLLYECFLKMLDYKIKIEKKNI